MMMEEGLSFMERKRAQEKLFTKKEVDKLLKEKQNQLDAQYFVLKEVYEQYEALKREHEQLKEKLFRYETPDDGYRNDWTWVAKIVFVLQKSGRPMRSAEIIEVLEKREEHLRNHTSKKQYFSAFINMALKAERTRKKKRRKGILLFNRAVIFKSWRT